MQAAGNAKLMCCLITLPSLDSGNLTVHKVPIPELFQIRASILNMPHPPALHMSSIVEFLKAVEEDKGAVFLPTI